LNGGYCAITSRSNRKKNIIITGSSRPQADPCNAKRNPPKRVFAISRLKAADFTARLKTGEVSSIGKR
jgi:hypothetical protein